MMGASPSTYVVDDFLSYTVGIVVYFIGAHLTVRVKALQTYNIPEPVSGGIIAALFSLGVYLFGSVALEFELETRDRLLVYFFTGVGLNARISDLLQGGRPLLVLLVLTLGYIFFQNLIGTGIALALGQPGAVGILAGSASLIGGHGTAIAWAPVIAKEHGVANALELGVAAATLGLVVASLLGGPIARRLLSKNDVGSHETGNLLVGIAHERVESETIDHKNVMAAILAMHIAIILGYILNRELAQLGLRLPLFVPCLLVAIVFSNTIPYIFPSMNWPARTKALAVLSDFALGLFIAMSLMGMQLWSVSSLAGPLLILLAVQVLATMTFIFLVVFPLMGRNYLAAVLSAGFAGFALGATPTAVANMTAVTKSHGPCPTAFIILPLVGAFFVDITNAFVIQYFLG